MHAHLLMRRIIGVCFVLFCASCSGVPADKIPGVYQTEHKFAKEQIVINPDGTFHDEVTLKSSGQTVVSTGKWNYNPNSGYIALIDGFMSVVDAEQKFNRGYANPLKGPMGLPVHEFMGKVRMGSDERLVYTKK